MMEKVLQSKQRLPSFWISLAALAILLIVVIVVAASQFLWIHQRRALLSDPTFRVATSTEVRTAPALLWIFGEQGQSWIEVKQATDDQVDTARRLFPEATVNAPNNKPIQK